MAVGMQQKSSRLAKSIKRAMPPTLFFVAVTVVWQVALPVLRVPSIIIPSPYEIYEAFIVLRPLLVEHTVVTIIEIILGFAIGSAVGFAMGIGIAYSNVLESVLYPVAVTFKVIPIIAIAPLLTLWFGFDIWSKIAAAAIITFFPLVVGTATGFRSVDPSLMDLLRSLSATEYQSFFKVRLPWSLPYIFAALKIAITLSVIGAVVGEFVGTKKGLGQLILVATAYLETAQVFAVIVLLAVLGIILFASIITLERIVAPWASTVETQSQ